MTEHREKIIGRLAQLVPEGEIMEEMVDFCFRVQELYNVGKGGEIPALGYALSVAFCERALPKKPGRPRKAVNV